MRAKTKKFLRKILTSLKKKTKKLKHSLDSKEPNDENVVYKPIRDKIYSFFFISVFGFSYFASALISELIQRESANTSLKDSIGSELSLMYSNLFTDGGFALRVIFNALFLAYILGYFLFIRRMEKSGKFIDKEETLKKTISQKIKDTKFKSVTTP